MKTIWKYDLPIGDLVEIEMPQMAEIIHVGIQAGFDSVSKTVQLWAEVETEYSMRKRTFVVYGTGHELHDDKRLKHIGSFIMAGGGLVFHVYEVLL